MSSLYLSVFPEEQKCVPQRLNAQNTSLSCSRIREVIIKGYLWSKPYHILKSRALSAFVTLLSKLFASWRDTIEKGIALVVKHILIEKYINQITIDS